MATIHYQREGGKGVDTVEWLPQEITIAERPNGPAAAALVSAATGIFFLGLFTVLGEASADIKDFLNIKDRVGPLSGKTTFAVAIYVAVWAVLAAAWWRRNLPWNAVLATTVVLVAIGLLFTFPEFFQLFAED